MVRFENKKSSGKIGVKIIGSKNPSKTLIKYYKAERRSKKIYLGLIVVSYEMQN